VFLFLVEPAESVGAHGLHDADEHESLEEAHEFVAVDGDDFLEFIEVEFEEFLADRLGDVGFSVVEEGGQVVLEGSLSASLVVDEPHLSVFKHDVA